MAYDFSYYDNYAPKGVEKIFEQFQNMREQNLDYIAALFIIAHDLTDYILERRSWNYQEYLNLSKLKFSDPIFEEIFSSLEKTKRSTRA